MDTLAKALAYDKQIRVYACVTTELVAEAQKRHGLWPSSAAALGRTLTASLLTAILKEENVTVKINGGGPIKDIVCEATKYGSVRGYVGDPYQFYQYNSTGKINVSYAVGTDGFLEVKTLINNEIFTSSAPLQTGEIADDFTYYFAASEQIPSSVGLGVLVNEDNTCDISGGIIIQVLPNATDKEISYVESKANLLNNFSNLLKEKSHLDILKMLFEENFEILEEHEVCFKCNCSKETFSRSLLTLGSKTLTEIKNEDHQIEAVCHYCNNKYQFNENEIQGLIDEALKQGK